ncbi:MAG: hypothetical protein PHZ19_06600 [Candidatus Thermoplasmatota archaeon]|nr:hypothetical protein [Candidatus Thermoplasmatota archaeon]
MIHSTKSLQKINLALRLALLTCLIDFSYFDRGLSLAIDRLTVAMEGGGNG